MLFDQWNVDLLESGHLSEGTTKDQIRLGSMPLNGKLGYWSPDTLPGYIAVSSLFNRKV